MDTTIDALRDAAQRNLRRTYAKGLEDGSRMILERLTGEHPEGPLVVDPATREWAADVLRRMGQ